MKKSDLMLVHCSRGAKDKMKTYLESSLKILLLPKKKKRKKERKNYFLT